MLVLDSFIVQFFNLKCNMKKLVFIFAALFALGLASCEGNKPANQGDKQDTTTVVVEGSNSTQMEATEVAPDEATEAPTAKAEASAEAPAAGAPQK